MAIKVNGTTVIDDSRNLSNVGGLKTVNGTSLVGSGNISAGASTTYGAVGTYIVAYPDNTNYYAIGSGTIAGNALYVQGSADGMQTWFNNAENYGTKVNVNLSGTWRAHTSSRAYSYQNTRRTSNLWLRIS